MQQQGDRSALSPGQGDGPLVAVASGNGAGIPPRSVPIRGAVVDLARGSVHAPDGKVTDLRRQSAEVLRVLVSRRGETVGKDALHAAVWGDIAVTDDSLVQCVADIRRALGSARGALRTVPREGYRLEPEETEAAGPAAGRRRWQAVALAAAAVVLAAALSLLGMGVFGPDQPPAARGPVVAVLPFVNGSGGERWDRLAGGITDELIADLGSHDWLFVFAGTTSSKHAGATPQEVRAALGADYVVSGRVQAEGDRVRVIASLADAASGRQTWSRALEGPVDDLLALQVSAAEALVAELASSYSGVIARAGRVTARRKAASVAAYDLYLIGIEHKHRFTEPDLRLADEYLRRATALDPGFARAWAGLAIVQGFLQPFATTDAEAAELIADQRTSVARAVAADPADPMVLLESSRIKAMDGDLAGAERDIRLAIERAPGDADVLAVAAWSGPERAPVGRDAVEWADRALALNPERPDWYMGAKGQALFAIGDDAGALAALREGPQDYIDGWVMMAAAAAALGDRQAAEDAVAQLRRLVPGFDIDLYLAGWPWEPGLRERIRAGAVRAGLG